MTRPSPAEHVERVLCVLAHPDDVDFRSAGTVASWTAAGKLAALRCHVTQVSHNPDIDDFVTGWMAQTARRFGLDHGRLAEAFHLVHTG